jgi:hypothetical protein
MPLLSSGGSQQYEVTFNAAGDPITIWVEFEGGTAHTEAFLTLTADQALGLFLAQQPQELPDAPFNGADVAKFVNKTELVVGFSGHKQAGVDNDNPSWQVVQNAGVAVTARELSADKKNPKPVMLFPENPHSDPDDNALEHIALCGTGAIDAQNGALINVMNAFVNHGAAKLAAYGYSHGGGTVWILSRELNEVVNGNNPDPLHVQFRQKWPRDDSKLYWTGYIDAVAPAGGADEELRLPFLTRNHFNRYQDEEAHPDLPTNGGATTRNSDGNGNWTPPAGFILDQNNTDEDEDPNPNPANPPWQDPWRNDLTHFTIDMDPHVRNHLIASLRRVLA